MNYRCSVIFFVYNREHKLVRSRKRGRGNIAAQWHNHVPFNWNNIERETESAERKISIIQLTVKLCSLFFPVCLFCLTCCATAAAAVAVTAHPRWGAGNTIYTMPSQRRKLTLLSQPALQPHNSKNAMRFVVCFTNNFLLLQHLGRPFYLTHTRWLLLLLILGNENLFAWKLFVCRLLHADSLRWFSVYLLHMVARLFTRSFARSLDLRFSQLCPCFLCIFCRNYATDALSV